MKLYVLRHGQAGRHGDPAFANDAERPLTAQGIRRTKALARALRQWEVTFDVVLSSPLVRARQTAEIVARGLRRRDRLQATPHLSPGGDAGKLIAQINAIRPAPDSVLLVGHEPDLSELISRLCAGTEGVSLTLKKGGLCRLGVEDLREARCASLEWLLAPRLFGTKRPKKQ
jgi:phosphohistidine phosphatase